MTHAVRISGGDTQASGVQQASSVTIPLEVRDTKTPGGEPAINRLLWVAVSARRTGGGAANTIAVTYNGVSMTAAGTLAANTTGTDSIYSQGFYLLETDFPANGTYDVVATISGGGTHAISASCASFANISQSTPLFTANQQANASNSVSLSISHPTDSATFFSQTHRANETVGHNSDNTQVEIADVGVAGTQAHRHSGTWTLADASIATPFSTNSSPVTSVDWTKSGASWDTEEDFTFLESTISVISTVSPSLLVPKPLLSTTLVQSAIPTADLQRDRGYVTTVAATATSTDTLDVLRDLISTTNSVASITAQPFERAAELRTLIETVSTVAPVFDATRPLSTVINAQAELTVTFGNTFAETQYSPTPGDYVELFEIDTTVIGGTDVFRFIPHRFETPDLQVEWKGETFIIFPVEADGFVQQATGAAPAQPTLRVSNVNKFIMAAILELGDLVGAKVTRWRTYARFLDNGETPDPDAHYAPDIYYVQQKTTHTREGFEFVLSSALDLPGIKLPRRQILKDQSSDDRNLYAPGAANIRFRGR